MFELPKPTGRGGSRTSGLKGATGLAETAAQLAVAGALTGLALSSTEVLEPVSEAAATVGGMASDSGHGHGHGR